MKKLIFFRYVTSGKRVFMNPRKVKAILKWKRPTNVTKNHSFHGLARYHKRFIKGFFTVAPLRLD